MTHRILQSVVIALGLLLLGTCSVTLAALPDGRVYEKVSPSDKNGFDVLAGGGVQSALDGDAVTFSSYGGAFAGNASAGIFTNYLARRAAGGGWTTAGIDPPLNPSVAVYLEGANYVGFSPDLSQGIVTTDYPLTPGADNGLTNVFRRDNSTGEYDLLTPGGPTVAENATAPGDVHVSSDMSTVAFESNGSYPPVTGPAGLFKVYKSVNGVTQLVSVDPEGAPLTDEAVLGGGDGASPSERALSSDGSRVYFTALSAPPQLYLNQAGKSTLVSASEREPADPHGTQPAIYFTASLDGSYAFFTSAEALTNDATTGPSVEGSDLYRYDANALAGHRLTDLSVDAGDPNGAQVQGVVGASEDGSYVYYVALGQVIPGTGVPGQPNLYLNHAGTNVFVATLDPSDSQDWNFTGNQAVRPIRITPDGTTLAFTTVAPQPGYDNADPVTGVHHKEVYLYHAADAALLCASCDPSGAPATGDGTIAASVNYESGLPSPNNLSSDGQRLFFESTQSLVQEDTNNRRDVYEYEDGHAALISDGAASDESLFAGASPTGDDAFFVTRSQLVRSDQDTAVDLYDARVGGVSEPAGIGATSGCIADACQGSPAAPPLAPTIGSLSVSGIGNASPPPAISPAEKVMVLAKRTTKVKGTRFTVRVRVPSSGTLKASGAGLRPLTRAINSAANYALRLSLTSSAEKRLKRNHSIKVNLRVTYAATDRTTSTTSVAMTLEG